jgi:hypothetical protein
LTPNNEARWRVQNLVEGRRKPVEEKTAQLNRLTAYLKVYFPQILEWFAMPDTKLACEFLERWPSPEELQAAAPERENWQGGRSHDAHESSFRSANPDRMACMVGKKPCSDLGDFMEPLGSFFVRSRHCIVP